MSDLVKYVPILVLFLSVGWDIIGRLTGRKQKVLAKKWNRSGRETNAYNSKIITQHYENRNLRRHGDPAFFDDGDDFNYHKEIEEDPRSEKMAKDVLKRVVKLNKKDKGSEVRKVFDPAHAPFLPFLESVYPNGCSLLSGVIGGQYGDALCISENGQVLWEFKFGSCPSHIDVCPKTERILITSTSGMVHLIDPKNKMETEVFPGFNAPKEEKRWIFWDEFPEPITW